MDRLAQRKDDVRDYRPARDDESIPTQAQHLTTDDASAGLGEPSRGVSEVSFDEPRPDASQFAEQRFFVEQLESALDKIVARQKIRAQTLGFLLRKALPAAAAADPAVLETLRKLSRVYRRKP